MSYRRFLCHLQPVWSSSSDLICLSLIFAPLWVNSIEIWHEQPSLTRSAQMSPGLQTCICMMSHISPMPHDWLVGSLHEYSGQPATAMWTQTHYFPELVKSVRPWHRQPDRCDPTNLINACAKEIIMSFPWYIKCALFSQSPPHLWRFMCQQTDGTIFTIPALKLTLVSKVFWWRIISVSCLFPLILFAVTATEPIYVVLWYNRKWYKWKN